MACTAPRGERYDQDEASQPINPVALSVSLTVEVGLPALVALAGDHRSYVPPAQAPSGGGAAVALVVGHLLRP